MLNNATIWGAGDQIKEPRRGMFQSHNHRNRALAFVKNCGRSSLREKKTSLGTRIYEEIEFQASLWVVGVVRKFLNLIFCMVNLPS